MQRGLMIDTGRNYLTPTVIKMAIDTMAYTKLNLLHWHIVDDECAPPLPHPPPAPVGGPRPHGPHPDGERDGSCCSG